MLNKPLLSLRTGTPIGTVISPIINPNNLKIEGFNCLDRFDKKKKLILLTKDIREFTPKGYIVNDHEVLSEADDLLRLKPIIDLNFQLLGKPVITLSKIKAGKVNDYAADDMTMYIQKLYASKTLVRNFLGGSLVIDRTQIVEITDHKIIIQDLEQLVTAGAAATI